MIPSKADHESRDQLASKQTVPAMAAGLPEELIQCPDLSSDVVTTCSAEWSYQMRRQMQEIISGLFLGPYASAMKSQEETLKREGITDIICVRQEQEARFIRINMPGSFTYVTLDIADSPCENIMRFFKDVSDYIDDCVRNGRKVLVHGNQGVSRSATLVIAYIMRDRLLSAVDALKFVQSKRFCVYPNEGFRRQLFEYEPVLRATVAATRRGLQGLPKSSCHPKRNISEVEEFEDDEQDGRRSFKQT